MSRIPFRAPLGLATVLVAGGLTLGAGAEVALEVRIDKDTAAIGEPITMTVIARHAEPLPWERRSVAERLGPFDVEQVSGPEEVLPEAGDANASSGHTTRWVFRLAAFEIGALEIPPLQIRYSLPGAMESGAVTTPARRVTIAATVSDPNTEPADIRTGFALPRDLRPYLWLAAGIVLAAAAAWAGWRYLPRRRPRPAAPARAATPPAPLRPAYERYLEALEALLGADLLEAGRIKEFHVRIAEILKGYLGEVHRFEALDRTTWEVMQELDGPGVPPAVRSETGAFLEACDLVKFAKHAPRTAEVQSTIGRARRILDLDRPAAGGGA